MRDAVTPASESSVDPQIVATRDLDLARWLRSNVSASQAPFTYELLSGGRSNLTYRVTDGAGRHSVLRRPPLGPLLPKAHDVLREFRLISAMARTGVPVPSAIAACSDTSVIGAPFYLMEWVEGAVVRHAAEAPGPSEFRKDASESLIDELVRIHSVVPASVGLDDLAPPHGYVSRQLRRWHLQYVASRDQQGGPAVPEIDAAHELLTSSVPPQRECRILHGDYRLDNVLVGADGAVRAVLDWELCSLGDPLADLGLLLAYWAEPGDAETVLVDPPTAAPGFASRSEISTWYAQKSGRDLSDLDFYVAFSYWKLACISEGVFARYANGAMADDDVDVAQVRSSIDWLARAALRRISAYINMPD
jgi:aminoglycoside phosphotransferase (APT) family kinase protein